MNGFKWQTSRHIWFVFPYILLSVRSPLRFCSYKIRKTTHTLCLGGLQYTAHRFRFHRGKLTLQCEEAFAAWKMQLIGLEIQLRSVRLNTTKISLHT